MQEKMRTGQNHGNVLCFSVSPYHFCLPAVEVVSIITPPRLTRLPFSAADVSGVFRYQGEIATCYDLRHKFSLPPRRADQQGRLLLGRDDGALLAFLVDEVSDIRPSETLDWRTVPLPAVGERVVSGCYLDGRTIILATSIRGLHRCDPGMFHTLSTIAQQSFAEEIDAPLSAVVSPLAASAKPNECADEQWDKKLAEQRDQQRDEQQSETVASPLAACDQAGEDVAAERRPAPLMAIRRTLASMPAGPDADSIEQIRRDHGTDRTAASEHIQTSGDSKSMAGGSTVAGAEVGRLSGPFKSTVTADRSKGVTKSAAGSISHPLRHATHTSADTQTTAGRPSAPVASSVGFASGTQTTTRHWPVDTRSTVADEKRPTAPPQVQAGAGIRQSTRTPFTGLDDGIAGHGDEVTDDYGSMAMSEVDTTPVVDGYAELRRLESSMSAGPWIWGIVAVLLLLTVAYPLINSRDISSQDISSEESGDAALLQQPAVSASTSVLSPHGQDKSAADDADTAKRQASGSASAITDLSTNSGTNRGTGVIDTSTSPTLSADDVRVASGRMQEVLRIEDNDLLIRVERDRQEQGEPLPTPADIRLEDGSQGPPGAGQAPEPEVLTQTGADSVTASQWQSDSRVLSAREERRLEIAAAEPAGVTASQASDVLKPGEFIRHRVVRGDTLWDIAKHYLGDPFRYPQLARLSRIRNPDLIYPGDLVTIARRESTD